MKKSWFLWSFWILVMACNRTPTPNLEDNNSSPTEFPKEELHQLFLDSRDHALSWNQAIDQHDLSNLEQLYAPEVRFFGDTLPRDSILARKALLFEQHPEYRQSGYYWTALCDASPMPPEVIQVEIGLREYMGLDTPFFNGHLIFQLQDAEWKIIEESDWVTNLQKENTAKGIHIPDGSYCLAWNKRFDMERDDPEKLVGNRDLEVKFTLEKGTVTQGWVNIDDNRMPIKIQWKIIGGQYERFEELNLKLLRVEEGDGPPVEPQYLKLRTRDGVWFSISGTNTKLPNSARLQRIECE